MEFLPRSLGTRPRLACEVRAEGVVAARGEDASGVLAAVSRVGLNGSGGRAALVAALRRALDGVVVRTRDVTLVVPDAAARVLLLEFDMLPSKPVEALSVVRFRLKKLLPFDADDAAVSYQVMTTGKSGVQVVAAAMPHEVLADYEGMVREAGFEPGAVLPSTLAALAGLVESASPVLVVNAGSEAVTTAIVKAGVLLLHRTVSLGADQNADRQAEMAARLQAEFGIAGHVGAGSLAGVIEAEVEADVAAERGSEAAATETAQAVSVAAAYFEDTLEAAPEEVLATGTLGAEALVAVLGDAGVGPVLVREMVDREMIGPGAMSAGSPGGVPYGWLAGVRGALAN
jgi:type IV pilus assembly protein PilM